jgi:hypothetical protein
MTTLEKTAAIQAAIVAYNTDIEAAEANYTVAQEAARATLTGTVNALNAGDNGGGTTDNVVSEQPITNEGGAI